MKHIYSARRVLIFHLVLPLVQCRAWNINSKESHTYCCRWNWTLPPHIIATSDSLSISISSLLWKVEALPILAKRADGVEADSTTAKRSRFSLLILIPWRRVQGDGKGFQGLIGWPDFSCQAPPPPPPPPSIFQMGNQGRDQLVSSAYSDF